MSIAFEAEALDWEAATAGVALDSVTFTAGVAIGVIAGVARIVD